MILKGKIHRFALCLCALFAPWQALAEEPRWLPEERVVAFPEGKVFDFGDVLLSDGALHCAFPFKNVGDRPLTIHNVISSCGCTTPEWPSGEIAPGDGDVIRATFTNDEGPFPFDKTLTVYFSHLRRPVVLRLRGVSHSRNTSLRERFPEHVGALGLRVREVSLGYVEQGRPKSDRVSVANLSDAPLQVAFTGETPGLSLAVSPNPIPPRSTATLFYSLDPRSMKTELWGRQPFRARFRLDGKERSETFTVRAFLRDDFSGWSAEALAEAPKAEPRQSYYEFGEVKAGTRIDARYQIRNTGRSDLVIRAIEFESGEGATGAARVESRCPITVRPGATATIRVSLETAGLGGEVLDVLTLVTNAPAKPLVNLFLTGNVINDRK